LASYPQLEAYLAGLPGGLDAYPSCEVKGSILRSMVSEPLFRPMEDLPEPLRKLVETPPLATQWVPEVHQLALMLASVDGHFVKAGGEAAFLAWGDRSSAAMLKSPLYRVMFALAGPGLLLDNMPGRLKALRRGTRFELVERGPRSARMSFGFPQGLYVPLMLRARARSIRGALEMAGGKHVAVQVADIGDTRASFLATFD
jgi:hypothetical protein